jgi:hypothetical protein
VTDTESVGCEVCRGAGGWPVGSGAWRPCADCRGFGWRLRVVAPDAPVPTPAHPLRAQDVEPLIGKEIG